MLPPPPSTAGKLTALFAKFVALPGSATLKVTVVWAATASGVPETIPVADIVIQEGFVPTTV